MRTCALVMLLLMGLLAAEPSAAAQTAPLGSPDYRPTPEQPMGWRGDGSGRYPGATPPTTWGRWVSGPFSTLRSSGGASADVAAKARPLADGMSQEWLILGPVKVQDVPASMDRELVAGEAAMNPAPGAKQGELSWKAYTMDIRTQAKDNAMLVVDFAQAFEMSDRVKRQFSGGNIEPLVGYAATTIYADAPLKVGVKCEGSDKNLTRLWVDGKPVSGPTVDLAKGANRFLVKVGSTSRDWFAKFRLFPIGQYDYQTKNIAWMIPMPGRSWSSPIIVGDKILVGADMGILVCVSKSTGKVLWAKCTTWYDGLSEADRQPLRAEVEPILKQIDQSLAALVTEINGSVSKTGLPSSQYAALRRKVEALNKLETQVVKTMEKADRRRFAYWDQHCGTSNVTPLSDGKTVYSSFWGGCKERGASVICAFDLDGNRRWAYFSEQTKVAEHGDHASGTLVGDTLFFPLGHSVYALKAASGELLWRTDISKSRHGDHFPGGTGAQIQFGQEAFYMDPAGHLFDPSDGKILGEWAGLQPYFSSLVVEGNVIYNAGGASRQGYMAGQLVNPRGGANAYKVLCRVGPEDLTHPSRPGGDGNYGGMEYVASPLVAGGLAYCVTQGGILTAVDAKAGKVVYTEILDLAPRLTWVSYDGVCASPALAGDKCIYITDDQGRTIVLQAGRTFKQLARNELTHYTRDGEHDQGQSSMVFEGSRMYYRSEGYLYCIGEE